MAKRARCFAHDAKSTYVQNWRLRPDRRLRNSGAGGPGWFAGLAVLAAVRFRGMLCGAAWESRQRAMEDSPCRCPCGKMHTAILAAHADLGNSIRDHKRGGEAD